MKTYQLTKFESYGLRNQSVNQCFLQFDVDDGIQNFTSFSVCLGVAEKAFSCMREYICLWPALLHRILSNKSYCLL